ncbi:MFS transporter [Propionibacterium freudenreichii]|nr:MFS transporter [Propionibacterium freudenreichii]
MASSNQAGGAMQRAVRRDYLFWLTATTSDMLSRAVWSLALPFVIFALTSSTATAGLVQSLGQIAYLCVMLLGGALVDRISRRTGMVVRGLTGMVLWIGFGVLVWTHLLNLWILIAIFLTAQLLDGLFGMADNAALRSIVHDDEQFVQVTGINQGREAAVRIGGGPIGGLLYALGAAVPFLVSGALLGLVIASAKAIRADLRPPVVAENRPEQRRGIVRSVAQGISFMWSQRIMRTLAITSLFINAAFSIVISTAMLGLLGAGYTALQLAYLETVYGVVMMLTAFVAARLVSRLPTGRLLIGAQLFMMVVAVGAAFWHSYAMLFLWLSLYGLVTPLFATSLSGYTFARTPDHLQGRVRSVAALLELSATMVIPAVAGWMVNSGHNTPSYLLGAVLALVGIIVVCVNPGARRLGPTRMWREDATENSLST